MTGFGVLEEGVAVFTEALRVGLTERATFGQRPQVEASSPVMWGRCKPGKGSSLFCGEQQGGLVADLSTGERGVGM